MPFRGGNEGVPLQVSSLLPGYRQRWRSRVILLLSLLSLSGLFSVTLLSFSIPLSTSSMPSHFSGFQFFFTVIAM